VPETAPRGIPKAIAGTLAAEIRKRREWDEAPCLYTLYVNGGRARLAPLPLPDHIWSGSPPQVLLAMADQADFFAPLLQTAAGPGLYGAAFRCEVWGVSAAASDPAAVRQMTEDGNARRIHARPDRVELRQIWAVDRARVTYVASQERGSDEVETAVHIPEPGMDHTGNIPTALDRLVSAFLGVTMPGRSLSFPSLPG
jgi:hypothetical protein